MKKFQSIQLSKLSNFLLINSITNFKEFLDFVFILKNQELSARIYLKMYNFKSSLEICKTFVNFLQQIQFSDNIKTDSNFFKEFNLEI